MTQQAQDDYYGGDQRAMALDYARAVNEEVKDMFAAGADVVQIDEPYMQARAEIAREFALEVIAEALKGVEGTTALHMCFGYAAIHAWQGLGKPDAYSFLPELNESDIDQISIEAAQPRIDLAVLEKLPDKTIILGVIDNDDPEIETPEIVAARIRAALNHITPERLILAPRLRDEIHAPRRRLRQAQVHGRGRGHRARGDRGVGRPAEVNPRCCQTRFLMGRTRLSRKEMHSPLERAC